MRKNNKKKTIFISGHFNVLHAGHLRLFRKAKEIADFLIVAIESNEIAGDSSHFDEKLRLEAVNEISLIDQAFIMRDSLLLTLKKLKPDFVLKGKEFEAKNNIEAQIIKNYGGKLIFNSGDATFSSLDVLKKDFELDVIKDRVPKKFIEDHNIRKKRLNSIIDKFKMANVAVIGDVIIDKYINCDALGMSHEDPTIVVTPIDQHEYIGGAGIVALHAKKLGATVDLYSVLGNDLEAKFVTKNLLLNGVNTYFSKDITRPTNLKTRYKAYGKTLLRVSRVKMQRISDEYQKKIILQIKKNINKYNLVVFSDFNYGVLANELIAQVTKLCKKNNILMIADSQSSSQIGDIGRFVGMNLLTPTEREARLATRNSEDGLVIMADILRAQSDAQNIFLTLGENGLLIHTFNRENNTFATDTLPALNKNPLDVSGAGDSMLISSGLSLVSGADIWESAIIGSYAASIQVSTQGNVPITANKLKSQIQL